MSKSKEYKEFIEDTISYNLCKEYAELTNSYYDILNCDSYCLSDDLKPLMYRISTLEKIIAINYLEIYGFHTNLSNGYIEEIED